MNNEYIMTFKKLLSLLELEITSLDKDLKIKTENVLTSHCDLLNMKESVEQKINNVKTENFDLRKNVSEIKIEVNNLKEELKKFVKNVPGEDLNSREYTAKDKTCIPQEENKVYYQFDTLDN